MYLIIRPNILCFYALIYYLKRNMNFWKKFSYTQKSQNKNFYLIDIKRMFGEILKKNISQIHTA